MSQKQTRLGIPCCREQRSFYLDFIVRTYITIQRDAFKLLAYDIPAYILFRTFSMTQG